MLHTYYKAFLQDWPVNGHAVSESVSVSVLHMLVVHCITELHVVLSLANLFKPGARRPVAPGFLKLILCRSSVCVYVCLRVCVSAPKAINN